MNRVLFALGRWLYPALGLLLLAEAVGAQDVGETNLALAKPVTASGATWGPFSPKLLTDGNPGTFSHPADGMDTSGYYFEVDLGRSCQLDRILVRNRADGCCTERLSNYRVELYADSNGKIGQLNWRGDVRTDGSDSGIAGVDTVTPSSNTAGQFAGRFLRIVNITGAANSPQVAEVEVFGRLAPVVRLFADDDAIASGGRTTLRWEIANAASASITPQIGVVSATDGAAVVRPAATVVYTLSASNEAGSSSAVTTIGVDVVLQPPELSEFLVGNNGGLKDDDGDLSDWIELRNPNPFSMRLGGYFLTDDPGDLTRWELPDVRMPARGFLVLFASGKDRRAMRGKLHTNFKFAASGGRLVLVDRGGRAILQQLPPSEGPATSALVRPNQNRDVSYGVGGNGESGFLLPPSPGASNGAAFAGIVAATEFSVPRGFYESNISVKITCATPGAVIRYTMDSSEPAAAGGSLYTGEVKLSKTTVLRAAAFKPGWAPARVATRTYIFPSDVIQSLLMNATVTKHPLNGPKMRDALFSLPSVSLVTTESINKVDSARASVEWLAPGSLSGFQEDCGVRHYGGDFTDFEKKNFRLYFRPEFGASRLKFPIFAGFEHGLAAVDEFDQLELRGGSHDMVERGFYMSNIFVDDTMLEMGHLNPHGRFVHLYINSDYWGVFHLRERWGAGMHHRYLGGSSSNYESINGNQNVGGWADPGVPYDGDGSAWARARRLRENYHEVRPWLDVPQYIDFMILWIFGRCEDEYRCVGPTVPGSGFKFYLNDADGFFQSPATPWYGEPSDRTARNAPGQQPGDGPGSFFSTLLAQGDPDYMTLLADRIYKACFNTGALTPARAAARLKVRCDELQKAFVAEAARWNYRTTSSWDSVRNDVFTRWLPTRTRDVRRQLRSAGLYPRLDAPVLNQQGGVVRSGFQVSFIGPLEGTILYTLDGSDPRLAGGMVAPTAHSFATGVRASPNADTLPVIVHSTVLKSRARSGKQWSALNEAFFQVGSSALGTGEVRITDLNLGDVAGSVELSNLSAYAVNLRGARFTQGIEYVFADDRDTLLGPGQKIVLVRNLFRFHERYGPDARVAGIFSGDLKDGGECITLTSQSGGIITSCLIDAATP